MQFLRFHSRKILSLFIPIYILVYYFTLYINPNHNGKYIITGILSLLGPVIATFILYIKMKQLTEKVEKNVVLLLFIGFLSYIIGELIWDARFIQFQGEALFPHISDLFFLLQSTLFLIALLYLVFHNKRIARKAIIVVDIIITSIVIITISWHLLIQKLYENSHTLTMEILISIAYPLIDLLIILGIFHIIYFLETRTFSKKTFTLFGIGMFIVTVADIVFLIQTAFNTYGTANLIDPLWSIGYLIIGLAFTFPDSKNKDKQKVKSHHKLADSHLLPIISVGILLIIIIQYISKIEPLLLGLILCFLLLFARQYLMLREISKLNKLLTCTSEQLKIKNSELEKTVIELEILNKNRYLEARTDFLTGTYNRRYTDNLIRTMINDGNNEKQIFSILLIDIDYFKLVNDKFGHDIGDIVLKKLANSLQSCIRKSDTLGRIGGEEFIVVLPKADLSESIKIAVRIQKLVEKNTIIHQQYKIPITVSIGVTVLECTDNFDSLYRRVDEALYNAKVDRNTIVVKTTYSEYKIK